MALVNAAYFKGIGHVASFTVTTNLSNFNARKSFNWLDIILDRSMELPVSSKRNKNWQLLRQTWCDKGYKVYETKRAIQLLSFRGAKSTRIAGKLQEWPDTNMYVV